MIAFLLLSHFLSGPHPFPGSVPLGDPWVVKGGRWVYYARSSDAPERASAIGVSANGVYAQLSDEKRVFALQRQKQREGAAGALVSLGFGTEAAGLVVCADLGLGKGLEAEAGRRNGEGYFLVRDLETGKTLWRKEKLKIVPYSSCFVEIVLEGGKARVVLADSTGNTVTVRSPELNWNRPQGELWWGLASSGGGATFRRVSWRKKSRFGTGTDDVLRLETAGPEAIWRVNGGGAWVWSDREHKWLDQKAKVERTSAVYLVKQSLEGWWHARVRVLPGTGGAGFLVHTDENASGGISVWLGGTWGNGALMVYAGDRELWSSPNGKWRYNTEYVLELEIERRTLQARLLAGDGEKIIAESPLLPLPAEVKPGFFALMLWRGAGRFSDFLPEKKS